MCVCVCVCALIVMTLNFNTNILYHILYSPANPLLPIFLLTQTPTLIAANLILTPTSAWFLFYILIMSCSFRKHSIVILFNLKFLTALILKF